MPSLALYPGFLYQMLSHCFGETHEENLSKDDTIKHL